MWHKSMAPPVRGLRGAWPLTDVSLLSSDIKVLCTVLIDSGAALNLISRSFVQELLTSVY